MLHYLLLLSSFHLMSPTNAFFTDDANSQFGFLAAANFGGWDKSSLELDINSIGCDEISLIITNTGDGNMVRPVNYYVYFHPDEEVREKGKEIRSDAVQVSSGTVGPLDNSGGNQSETIYYTPSEAGIYVFVVERPEGHANGNDRPGDLLSTNIPLDDCITVTDDVYGDSYDNELIEVIDESNSESEDNGSTDETEEIKSEDEAESSPEEDSNVVDDTESKLEDDITEETEEDNSEETKESKTVTDDVYGDNN